jgi:DNA-binding transcriptional regulator of glucitol operon
MLKITLREMFLLVLVVALALGWWIDHRDLSRYKRGWNRIRNMGFLTGELEKDNRFLDP